LTGVQDGFWHSGELFGRGGAGSRPSRQRGRVCGPSQRPGVGRRWSSWLSAVCGELRSCDLLLAPIASSTVQAAPHRAHDHSDMKVRALDSPADSRSFGVTAAGVSNGSAGANFLFRQGQHEARPTCAAASRRWTSPRGTERWSALETDESRATTGSEPRTGSEAGNRSPSKHGGYL
jgi:hypothetical protein